MSRWLAIIAYDQDLHVHHKSYANLENESPEDLEPLCKRCHELETFGESALHAPQDFACVTCGKTTFDSISRRCDRCRIFSALMIDRKLLEASTFLDEIYNLLVQGGEPSEVENRIADLWKKFETSKAELARRVLPQVASQVFTLTLKA